MSTVQETQSTRLREGLENLVILVIILVLFQTFLEDLAVVLRWSSTSRRILTITGFGFDLFFTVEFLVRLYDAFRYRKMSEYMTHQRGWLDFLASIPLLLLNSGPAVLSLAAGNTMVVGMGGMLNVLKVVKAIRIARVLRLLRLLKIFRRIKNTDSVMAQRHVAKISTVTVSVMIFSILVVTLAASFLPTPSLDEQVTRTHVGSFSYIVNQDLAAPENENRLEAFGEANPALLLVKERGQVRYNRFDNQTYEQDFLLGDYGYLEREGVEVFLDLRGLNQESSRSNIIYFLAIVAIVLALLFYYSPHFALTVSDPIHIMRRGFSEKGYNLAIRIPKRFENDDVYRLAKLYNEIYLPLKDRNADEDESSVVNLDMDDVKKMFRE
ncbi:MAG: ion transporter [Alkalispirochaetaceae bacterium]